MKIVLTTNHPLYLSTRYNLVNGLKQKGFEIVIFAPFSLFDRKMKERLVDLFKCECVDYPLNVHGKNPFYDIKTLIYLYRKYRLVSPDYVLNFTIKPNIYSTIAAKLLGIKAINNITGLGPVFTTNSFSSIIGRYLYFFSQIFSYRIFFQNPDDLKLFVDSKLVKCGKCGLIPGSGVDIEKYTYEPLPHINDSFKFTYIGKLYKDKGFYELVDAVKLLKEKGLIFEMNIVGPFIKRKDDVITEAEVKELESKSIIKYWGEQEDVIPFLKNTHCVVLPSYREGTPRSLLEAASIGRPLIATNVPGCNRVVEDNYNGYLCEVKSSKSLCEVMEKMINSPYEVLNKLGKSSRVKIEKEFDDRIVLEKYILVLSNNL